MIKTKTETKTIEQEVVVESLCNCCGKSFDDNEKFFGNILRIQFCWGYASRKDMIEQFADICEECWDNWCKTFIIAVEEKDRG